MDGGIKKNIAKNSMATVINFFLRWLILMAFSFLLPLEEFGKYSSMNAIANILVSFFVFGSTLYLVKEVSEKPEEGLPLLRQSNNLSVSLFLIFPLLFIPILSLYDNYKTALTMFAIASLIAIFISLTRNGVSYLKGSGDFIMDVKLQSMSTCTFVLLTAIMLAVGLPWNYYSAACVAIITFSIPFLILRRRLTFLYSGGNEIFESKTFFLKLNETFLTAQKKSPYASHEILVVIGGNIPIFVINTLGGYEEIGMYQSIALFFAPATIFPLLYSVVLLKEISAMKTTVTERLMIFRKMQFITAFLAIIIVIAIYLLFFTLKKMNIKAGMNFSNFDLLFLLMGINLFFRFFSANYGVLLTKLDRQRDRVRVGVITILLQVIVSALLYPLYGFVSVVVGQLTTTLCLLFIYVYIGEMDIKRGNFR